MGVKSKFNKIVITKKTIVRKKMLKVYPQLKNTRIDFAWGGTLAVTRNRLPYFAKIQPNVSQLLDILGME